MFDLVLIKFTTYKLFTMTMKVLVLHHIFLTTLFNLQMDARPPSRHKNFQDMFKYIF